MGTTAARKARMILDNSQKVVGIELLAAAQALWLRGESLLAPATAAVYQKIRQTVPPVDTDVVMYPQMAAWSSRAHCSKPQNRSAAGFCKAGENRRPGLCMDARPGRQTVSLINDDSHMNIRRKYNGKAC